MTSTPEHPAHDGSDLAELRSEIDALKAETYDEVTAPEEEELGGLEGTPEPTDAIGSVDWDRPEEDATKE